VTLVCVFCNSARANFTINQHAPLHTHTTAPFGVDNDAIAAKGTGVVVGEDGEDQHAGNVITAGISQAADLSR
jgi:hypothetical protein